ncbi:TadG family pilus assembly protein [Stenotrophomonas indicatrix]|uniref:TadG family pilus assembly protein n=1 Tax=Stenotrophomonas indicatrix TaxID=2045451 RepID=UPI0028EF5450|nr:TadG family pilus assembly protein [Stenotrophomonas indicatrix]MDT9580302.1 TadG family pilus assembly protein [Stenotrophomonas indicatrix]
MNRARHISFSRPRGGMSVTMMLVMIALLAMLGLIEIGFLFWAKRDAQKVVDLAALAGAQRLDLCRPDNADNSAARQNALAQNTFPGQVQIQCGNWNATRGTADHFSPSVDAGNPRNAVRVIAERGVLPFFGQNSTLPTLRVQAVAKRSEPTAVFAVGSQLLRTNGNSPLMATLRLVGLDVTNATVLSYDGLAQATVTPSGLLAALGIPVTADLSVADFNRLLSVNRISLAQLVNATATVVGRETAVGVQLQALSNLVGTRLDINQLNILLGSQNGGGGLFAQVISPDGTIGSALESRVNVLDLVTAAISIANDGNGVQVQGLNLLGIDVKAGVVEPPSIAIGGVGARAYNAQVRLMLDVDSDRLFAIGPLLNLLGTRLHLPLHVDVANAMGTLTSIQCGAAPPTATVQVDSSVLRACVGKVNAADRFSKSNVCDATLQNEQLLRLLGQPLINDKVTLPALTSTQSLTLAAGETGSTRINPLAVGTAVSDLVNELLRVLSGMLSSPKQGMSANDTAKALADRYLQAAFPSGGRYNVDQVIPLLRDGDPSRNLAPLGNWTVTKGVPKPCLLGLTTCWEDGSVWTGYRTTVTGQGLGLLDGLLGSLVGGLLINRCDSLLGNLIDYNGCVRTNLASYIQTAPAGFLDGQNGGGVTTPGNNVTCSGLLCALLNPVLAALKPVLNSVGTLLTNTLASLLGLELGRTDVSMQSIQCSSAQLVF